MKPFQVYLGSPPSAIDPKLEDLPLTPLRRFFANPRFSDFNKADRFSILEIIEIARGAGDGQTFRMPLKTLLCALHLGINRWNMFLLPKLVFHGILTYETETDEKSAMVWVTIRLADWIKGGRK